MELKILTLKDREMIAALFRDVFTREPWRDDWSDTQQLRAYIADLTGRDNSLSLGYMDGDRPAALALGQIRHWHAGTQYVIDELCVDHRLQGQGIGTRFLNAAEEYLRSQGIRGIFLQTDRGVPAFSFYTHRGFHALTEHVSLFKPLSPSETAPPADGIRPARESDRAFWFSLDRRLDEDAFLHKVRSGMASVLFSGGRAAGVMRWSLFWDSIPFLDLIRIDDALRRRGLGRRLVSHWETEMRTAGYTLVMVSTQADEEAQHFYRALGYKDCGAFTLPFPGWEQPAELILAKAL